MQGTPPHRNSPVILLQFGSPNLPPTSRIWRNYSVLPHFLQPIIHLSHSQENRLEAALSLKGREPGATPPNLLTLPIRWTGHLAPGLLWDFLPGGIWAPPAGKLITLVSCLPGPPAPWLRAVGGGGQATKPGCRLLRMRESKKSKEERVLCSRALRCDSKDRTSREVTAALGPSAGAWD